MKKITLIFIFLMVLLGLFIQIKPEVYALVRYRLMPDYPKSESPKIVGLEHPVQVVVDEFGIPHIKAESPQDLAMVVGYYQWRDRGWQMDFLRHFASGRLSELLGRQQAGASDTVMLDRAMRAWNLEGRLPKDLSDLDPFDQKIISAFLAGLSQSQAEFTPLEYRLLNLEPQAWDWRDLYLVSLTQAWSISHNWEHELVRLVLSLRLGFELADEIYPLKASSHHPTLKTFENSPIYPLPPRRAPELLDEPYFKNPTPSLGPIRSTSLPDLFQWRPAASNAWVISGDKTHSGSPMLANDMHLTHSLPSLLYLMHVALPDREMIGVTLPGLPFPVAGHNSKVAWGITSTVADVMDLVIEKLDPQDETMFLSESGPCPLTKRTEQIQVKDEGIVEAQILESCRGFILNSSHPYLFSKNDPMVALQWNVRGIENTLRPLYEAMGSANVDELKEAMQQLALPAQNVTAADREGNISFFSVGKIPLRPEHQGLFPIPGWLERYRSTEYAANSDLPFQKNPESGVLINANNLTRDPESHPVLVHIDSAPDYRHDRIRERLEERTDWSQQDFASIQLDIKLHRAAKILPFMLEDLELLRPQSNEIISILEAWDMNSDIDSVAMGVFAHLFREMIWSALGERLDDESRRLFLKQRYSTNTVDLWFERADHPIWKTHAHESGLSSRTHRMKLVLDRLNISSRQSLQGFRWGNFHRHQPRHVFGKKRFLDFMNLEEIEISGSIDSVWKVHFDMNNESDPFRSVAGAAYRFVIDLAHPEQAQFILDTGQSGWPLSPHYSDQYKLWAKGQMLTPIFPWREFASDKRVKLIPAESY
jgi:penicillin G amidase